jgi:hypothetical protein
MALNERTQNYVLGAGKIYFAPEGSEAERYLGDSPGISLTVESESIEVYDSDGPTAEKIVDHPTKVTRKVSLSVRDVNKENLALFLGGDSSTHTQTSSSVTGESINGAAALAADRTYQLGVASGNPVGVRGMTSVTITKGATTYVLDTDYELDAALGRIRVLSGGALVGTTAVLANYTRTANTRTRAESSDTVGVRGKLTFIADNSSGDNRDLVAPLCVLKPSGEFALKSRDTIQEMSFECELLKRDTATAMIYVDGRPA